MDYFELNNDFITEDKPISRNVSYSRRERHINEKEKMLMSKFNMGYSELVKNLVQEKYEEVFRNKRFI